MKRLLLLALISFPAFCQNAVMLPWTPQQFTNTNGTILVSGKVCTYLGGTSTGTASFTDSTAGTSNAIPPNAILLDSTGRPTSGGIWLTPGKAYKIVTMTAGSDGTCNTGVVVKTQDNVIAAANTNVKPATTDAVRYVTASGSDANDGLSWGSAKATISAAVTALPTCTPTPSSNNAIQTFAALCGVVYLGENGSAAGNGYNISSPLIINSTMVRIIGVDKFGVQIQCGNTTPCIEFNGANLNGNQFSPNPVLGASGGLEKLTLIGSNTASQIGLYNLDAGGINHRDLRISGFTGTSACGMTLGNDANGESERIHLDALVFENNTQSICLTASNGGGLGSIAHQNWTNIQFSLGAGNNQTAISASNFATVACEMCTGVINTNLPNTNSYTGVKLANSATIKGFFQFIVDNGAGATFTATSGTGASTFQVNNWNPGAATYVLQTLDSPFYNNVTTSNANNGVCFQLSGVQKDCIGLDGSNFLGFFNATPTEVVAVSNAAGGGLWFTGSSSGATNVLPSATASGTLTLPAATDTLIGRATTDTLTNKTLTGPIIGSGAAITSSGSGGIMATTITPDSLAGTYRVIADQTITAGASLTNIPGLTWTFPANTALNVKFTCDLLYSQATAAASDSFGFQDVTVAPTNAEAYGRADTNTTAFTAGNTDAAGVTTAVTVVTFTPSAATTVFGAHINGLIEQPSNASTSVFNIMAQFTTNNGTIKRGSSCQVY